MNLQFQTCVSQRAVRAAVAFCAMVLLAATAMAHPGDHPEPGDLGPPADAGQETLDGGFSYTSRPVVQLDEAKEKPTAMQAATSAIDGAFAQAVEGVGQVLFYRIWQHAEHKIELQETVYYVRAAGHKTEPFVRLTRSGVDESDAISNNEALRMRVLGKLSNVDGDNAVRTGKYFTLVENNEGEQERQEVKVDYLTRVLRKATYILGKDNKFHKLTPKRQLLSKKPEDTLTWAQAQKLANTGLLKFGESNLARLKAASKAKTLGSAKPGSDLSRIKARPWVISSWTGGAPLVVLWLAMGATIFTLYMRFFNFWGFRHAIEIVRGKFDDPAETGEVTHFQALASALSATVGLGNIAGVTIAMTLGGPGAFFWMLFCGFFGMMSKFVESTLGQKYRVVKEDGTILGGPMRYLHAGLAELGLGGIGYVLAMLFAVMCIFASFGGGNMFQANQATEQMLSIVQKGNLDRIDAIGDETKAAAEEGDFATLTKLEKEKSDIKESMESVELPFKSGFGLVMALMVGIVIIGGIKRIGAAASKVVPTMCAIYLAACLFIIASYITEVPSLILQIFTEAFNPQAFGGGILGVAVIGIQRAAFSNEAGVGSAAIAHSAAKTEEPVREGCVAMLGPFIDTIVVCSMTALVILITGAYDKTEWVVDQGLAGTPLTSKAFGSVIPFFPYVLSFAVLMFAYSTMISWSYYGERCWVRLFGTSSTLVYKGLYVVAVFVGSIVNAGAVLDFSDMMILSMAFPNIFGLILLSPKVRADLLDYWVRYKAGKFKTFK